MSVLPDVGGQMANLVFFLAFVLWMLFGFITSDWILRRERARNRTEVLFFICLCLLFWIPIFYYEKDFSISSKVKSALVKLFAPVIIPVAKPIMDWLDSWGAKRPPERWAEEKKSSDAEREK